jgi:transposase
MAAAPALPDLSTLDIDALRSLLLAKHSELVAQQERLLSRDSEIEHLKLLVAKLRRMIFGAKSESLARSSSWS